MKFSHTLTVAFFAALLASGARAAEVDVSGTTYNLGAPVAVGQYGTISTAPVVLSPFGTTYDTVTGALAPNTEITFTYNGAPSGGYLVLNGAFPSVATQYSVTSLNGSVSANATSAPFGSASVSPGTLPVLITANVTGSNGVETLTNLSSSIVNFSSYFLSAVSGLTGITASYSVAAVPLPASAVLFGTALLALGGLSFARKSRQA